MLLHLTRKERDDKLANVSSRSLKTDRTKYGRNSCGFSQKNCACLCTVDRLNGSYISENKNDFKYGKRVHSIYTVNRTTFEIVGVLR